MVLSKVLSLGNGGARLFRGLVVIGSLLLLMTLSNTHVVMAQDQDNELPWRQNLTCDPAHQEYQGVEYCTGLNGRAHVLVVDLHDESGIRFEYVIAEGRNNDGEFGECRDVNIPKWSRGPGCYDPNNDSYYPVMSLSEAVGRYSPATTAIINTDYGARTPDLREHGPEGLTVIRGDRIDGPLPNGPNDTDDNAMLRPWLAISEHAPFQILFDQLESDDGSKPEKWMYTAFGGAPWLIRSGDKQEKDIRECKNARGTHPCTSTVAQTAVAVSENGRWLYLVVANGVDANDIADFMLETMQPWEAIKLDGGGSSQLWYGGLPEGQRVADRGDGRHLSQYLAIIAPPGDGIDLEPSPIIQPPDLNEWWEQLGQDVQEWWAETLPPLQESIDKWWEQTWDDLQQRLNEWWEEQQEALVRWIETELEQVLNQLCGAAALPAGAVVIVWIQNQRRKRW